jgi:hypothetical protein
MKAGRTFIREYFVVSIAVSAQPIIRSFSKTKAAGTGRDRHLTPAFIYYSTPRNEEDFLHFV